MTVTDSFSRACVIGLGYIGLPTAVTIANTGVEVCGVDIRSDVVERLNKGEAHFSEPDLEGLLVKVVAQKSLYAALAPEPADAFIIAVPTPFKDDKQGDTSYVEAAARSIAPVLAAGNLIVVESTSPIGTTEMVCDILAEIRPDLRLPHHGDDANVFVAYCPERILPGQMMRELIENDRIVGGITPACASRARALYETFVRGEIHEGLASTAELVKLSENAYRDVNIAFANELSILCRKLGIDVFDAIHLANKHPRVNILQPGAGVGGHCIAVDPWFLIAPNPDETPLMRAAREVNNGKPQIVIKDIAAACEGLDAPVIACLGATYKPEVDDVRESPALKIINKLAEGGTDLLVVEPQFAGAIPGMDPKAQLVSLEAALEKADVLAILVDHKRFRSLAERDLSKYRVVDPGGTLTKAQHG